MKAAIFNKYGDPSVIEIVQDAKEVELKENQVKVEVYAASLNPIESAIRNGYVAQMLPLEFPLIAGGDFSGVIKDSNHSNFKEGDEVFGVANHFKGASGAIAEFIPANIMNMALKPKSIDFEKAAALPLVGASTVQALEEEIKLQKDQKILIHGGAGGIGALAVQLAKHIGAYVIATASTDDVEFVKGLGADQVIDFKSEKFEEMVKDLDAVFVTAKDALEPSVNVLKDGGMLVSMVGAVNEEKLKGKNITAIAQMTKSSEGQLKRVAELVDEGIIQPQVARVFRMEETAEAFRVFETEHPKGKIVIKIK